MAENLDAPLVERLPLTGAYVLLTFRHPHIAHTARAGQFVMIKASTVTEPLLRRPFSIMTVDPLHDTFSLFLKAVGPGSRGLADLRPGEVAPCLGPLGQPFPDPPAGHDAVLVAGGYGIAPFYLFTQQRLRAGALPHVFYGGRTAADLQLLEQFGRLGVSLKTATDDGSAGHHGRVTEPLEQHLARSPERQTVYASGPDPMLHAVAHVAERRGVTAHVSLDPWMGCGVGTCLGCVVWIQGAGDAAPHRRCACTEGPVFEASEVVWRGETVSLARRAVAGRSGPA